MSLRLVCLGNVSWGFKNKKLIKNGKKVSNMCYSVFRVETLGYDLPRTTIGFLGENSYN